MEQSNKPTLTPKVSVIIPVFNTEKYVRQTLDSICQQTLHELEIIVVNDGSTDNSAEIVQEIARKDSRIQVINQKNQGLSLSRNNGMKVAKGQYVYFMDSDDWLEKDALECCLIKCENDKLDFVFFDAESFYDEEDSDMPVLKYCHTKGLEEAVYQGDKMLELQLAAHQFTPSACLSFIRRSFLIEYSIEFYPHILHEDQLFTCQLYLNSKRVGFISRSFFHRRMRLNSIMTRCFTWRNIEGYLKVSNYLIDYRNHNMNKQRSVIDQFLSQMLDAVVWQSHKLPYRQRFRLFGMCLLKYIKYVRIRTIMVLLLKKKTSI